MLILFADKFLFSNIHKLKKKNVKNYSEREKMKIKKKTMMKLDVKARSNKKCEYKKRDEYRALTLNPLQFLT